jgi:putative N-acetyltransferase (TIGR04045 family)
MSTTFKHDHFHIKWAANDWEKEQAFRIRRSVFCEEQGLFEEHDRDEIDRDAITLVAVRTVAGMPDSVVGTVRISQSAPRIWWGSRLAVDPAFRRQGVLGAGLITLAVRSANSLGCDVFLATVQAQNERLFERLNWHTTGTLSIHNMPHVKMQADLSTYPYMDKPDNGFWVEGRSRKISVPSSILEGMQSGSFIREPAL